MQHQPSPRRAAAFHVDVAPERDVVRVSPLGELDLATTPLLQTQLRELHGAGFERIVLDLRELTFIDSSGIRMIVDEDAAARAGGRELTIVNGRPAVRRALEICGLRALLRLDAAAATPSGAAAGRGAPG